MNHRCHIIANPVSGGGSRRGLASVIAALKKKGVETELHVTGGNGEAAAIASSLVSREDRILLAVWGGDGTVNEVLNGCAFRSATIAVMPAGTTNVLARELGITGIGDAVDRIVRNVRRPVSLGLLEKNGTKQLFALMAGIGFDGSVVRNIDAGRKRFIGKGEYLFSALRELARWGGGLLRVSCDAGSFECRSLIASNIALYGGSFVIAPGADIFTPSFSVLCFSNSGRLGFLRSAAGIVMGKTGVPGVFYISTAALTVEGTGSVQIDGDYACETPVRLSAFRSTISFIV